MSKTSARGMNKAVRWGVSGLLTLVLILLDQWTKRLAVTHLKGQDAFVLIEGVLELDYLENRGVAFGMLQNQRLPILIFCILMMSVLIFLMARLPRGRKYDVLQLIFACILAGGIGNMIDRFFLAYVVDFISFVLINFPIFNVADCYVVCAVIGLFIMMLFVLTDEELDFLNFKKKALPEQEKQE